jgi:hypothetical protein
MSHFFLRLMRAGYFHLRCFLACSGKPGEHRMTSMRSNLESITSQADTALTREQRRSRRKRSIRARTLSVSRISKRDLAELREVYDGGLEFRRPHTRAECVDGPRPCPHVSCRYHLYLDISSRTGAIKLNFPDLEVWELEISCALDIADGGAVKLEDVGALMNVTRERVRQIELTALSKLEALQDLQALRDVTVG